MTFTEEFKITGEQIFSRIKELLQEGNIRRLKIRNKDGKVLLDTTVTIGSVGMGGIFLMAPLLTIIAAIVLSLREVSVEVEREASDGNDPHEIVR